MKIPKELRSFMLEQVEMNIVAAAVARFILTDTTTSPDIQAMARHLLDRADRLRTPELPIDAALNGRAAWKDEAMN